MADLLGIAVREKSRAPMVELQEVQITIDLGMVGDSRGKRTLFEGKRQITILSAESWIKVCELAGTALHWTTRRVGLFVDSFVFGPGDVGKKVYIGEQVILQITGETKPCARMDEAHDGLQAILKEDWRGGVTCTVIQGGHIKIGDEIVIH